MISRFLDALDEAAGGAIRLAYLIAGITAVAVYFGAGHLPPLVEGALNAALPWALAFAIETHTYITARRVRSAWQDMQSATHGDAEWTRARDALRVNLGILAALLAFSCWNQLNYLVETWTPPATAFALPGWVAYVVRALIVPAAFMCAAFLAPMAAPIAAQVELEARATLHDVFKIARKQRRKLLRQAQAEGRDMTGALVELVEDPAARRIISHAYKAIRSPLALPAPTSGASEKPSAPPPVLPTGPGTPTQAPAPTETKEHPPRPALVPLPMPEKATPRRAAARGSNTPRRRGVRTPAKTETVERQARAAWVPGMTVSQLQEAADISRNAASTWRRILAAESAQEGQQTAL